VVETEHPTEPDASFYRAMRWHRRPFGADKPITQALMIPLGIVARDELARGTPQRPLADEDDSIKALVLNRAYETLSARQIYPQIYPQGPTDGRSARTH
jgi:hypothetical protein